MIQPSSGSEKLTNLIIILMIMILMISCFREMNGVFSVKIHNNFYLSLITKIEINC